MTVTGKKKSRRNRNPEESTDQYVLVYQNPKKNTLKPKNQKFTRKEPVSFVMEYENIFDSVDDTI